MGMGCISHHHWLDSFQQFNTGNCLQRQLSWFPARSSVQKEELPFSWSEALMAVSSSILLTWFFFFLSWRSWHFVLSFHCSTYHSFYFPGWKLQPGRCCHHLPHAWLHIADENKGHYKWVVFSDVFSNAAHSSHCCNLWIVPCSSTCVFIAYPSSLSFCVACRSLDCCGFMCCMQ